MFDIAFRPIQTSSSNDFFLILGNVWENVATKFLKMSVSKSLSHEICTKQNVMIIYRQFPKSIFTCVCNIILKIIWVNLFFRSYNAGYKY